MPRRPARPGAQLFPEPDEWINAGDSVVVAPGRQDRRRPAARGARHAVCAEIDLERVGMARRSLDVAGHYARPDLFQLHVNTPPGSSRSSSMSE